jgi:hypothetical protein
VCIGILVGAAAAACHTSAAQALAPLDNLTLLLLLLVMEQQNLLLLLLLLT